MDTTIPFKYSPMYIFKHKYIWKFPNFETHQKIIILLTNWWHLHLSHKHEFFFFLLSTSSFF
jgi:hypothetical protein